MEKNTVAMEKPTFRIYDLLQNNTRNKEHGRMNINQTRLATSG